VSYGDFALALKSTLDYHAKLLADSKGLPFVDLAAAPFESDVLESDQPAICWEFATLSEMPVDPLWHTEFDVGAMAMLDPAQYISLDIVGAISNLFKPGARFEIRNYSGDEMPTETAGSLFIVSAGVAPQQSDRATGMRFVSVGARAVRDVS
jgi:hypothetical protein